MSVVCTKYSYSVLRCNQRIPQRVIIEQPIAEQAYGSIILSMPLYPLYLFCSMDYGRRVGSLISKYFDIRLPWSIFSVNNILCSYIYYKTTGNLGSLSRCGICANIRNCHSRWTRTHPDQYRQMATDNIKTKKTKQTSGWHFTSHLPCTYILYSLVLHGSVSDNTRKRRIAHESKIQTWRN